MGSMVSGNAADGRPASHCGLTAIEIAVPEPPVAPAMASWLAPEVAGGTTVPWAVVTVSGGTVASC